MARLDLDHVAVAVHSIKDALRLYRDALALRHELRGPLAWEDAPPGTLVFSRDGAVCVVNVNGEPLHLPEGEVLLTSEPLEDDVLRQGAAAWVRSR